MQPTGYCINSIKYFLIISLRLHIVVNINVEIDLIRNCLGRRTVVRSTLANEQCWLVKHYNDQTY